MANAPNILDLVELTEFVEWHHESVLVGDERVTLINVNTKRLVMGVQCTLHQKLLRPDKGDLVIGYGPKTLTYPISAFTEDAVAARYVRFKHALQEVLDEEADPAEVGIAGGEEAYRGARLLDVVPKLLEGDDHRSFSPLLVHDGEQLSIRCRGLDRPDIIRVRLHGYQWRAVQ